MRQVASGDKMTLFLKKDGTVLECGHVPPVAGRPVTANDMYVPKPVTGFGPGSGVRVQCAQHGRDAVRSARVRSPGRHLASRAGQPARPGPNNAGSTRACTAASSASGMGEAAVHGQAVAADACRRCTLEDL